MSEPHHTAKIPPGVMSEIARRISLHSDNHQRGVLAALKGFRGGHKAAVPGPEPGLEQAEAVEQPEPEAATVLTGTI